MAYVSFNTGGRECKFRSSTTPFETLITYRNGADFGGNGHYSADAKLSAYTKSAQIDCPPFKGGGSDIYTLRDIETIMPSNNGEMVHGSSEIDHMTANMPGSRLHSYHGADILHASAEGVQFYAGPDNDLLIAQANNTVLQGEEHNDTYRFTSLSLDKSWNAVIIDKHGDKDRIIVPAHLSINEPDYRPTVIKNKDHKADIEIKFSYVSTRTGGQDHVYSLSLYMQNWQAEGYKVEELQYEGDSKIYDLLKIVQEAGLESGYTDEL